MNASYWGQDGANSQQRLSAYCQDDTVDVIPLAFLYIFRGTGGEPVIDFANVSYPASGVQNKQLNCHIRLATSGTIQFSPARL